MVGTGSRGVFPFHREWAAMRSLTRLLVPIMAGSLLNVMADRWTLAFVGHWDYKNRAHYDGAGIGKMYSNIFGLSLGVSATIGLATFCSQAHGAGRSREMNPVLVRRCMLLLLGCLAVALIFNVLCEPLLTAVGQPPAVARTSGRFAVLQLTGVPFYWLSSMINITLNSTKRTAPGLVMNFMSSIAQVSSAFVLIHPKGMNMGYLGMALGRAIGGWVALATIVVCVKALRLQSIVWRLQRDAEPVMNAAALRSYLAVSIPSALVVWSEWWAFEVLTVFVGLTPDAELNLAAHGTMFNFIVPIYMCWTGTCTAVCALVGNLLGEDRRSEIKPLLRATFVFSLCSSLVVAFGYELSKNALAAAFTEDPRVRELIARSSAGLVLSVPLYAQLMSFYGALRGANLQKPGIMGTFIGYWVVGLPLGGVAGCVWQWPTPLLGVWLGNVVALAIAASWVLAAVFCRIDWLSVTRVAGPRTSLLGGASPQDGHRAGEATNGDVAEMTLKPVREMPPHDSGLEGG